jgi:hypothetical protein
LKSNGDVEYFNQRKWIRKDDADDYCVDELLLSPEEIDPSCSVEKQDILWLCASSTNSTTTATPQSDMKVGLKDHY